MKTFTNSQFDYCPLVWMNHGRILNNKINRIHEKALRVACNDNLNTFHELLLKDKSVTVHTRNLQVLVTEMFKNKLGISSVITNDIFQSGECSYNLRNKREYKSHCVKTVHYGTEGISFLGPKLWAILPQEYKDIDKLIEFKEKIKTGCLKTVLVDFVAPIFRE